jgi:hypothetical protein
MEFINDTNPFITTTARFDDLLLCNNLSNKSNNIRTSDDLSDSLQNTASNLDVSKNDDERNNDDINNIPIGIYRYKFTNEFTNELFKFSKVHQYDHRKDFKEAWEVWMDDNENIVDEEVRRLTNLGYDGDIIDKMFKSARYYFRKKSTEKKAPAKRRIYVGSQKDLLEAMDDHIKSNISSREFKPSDGFDEFCKKNIDILKEQVNMLCQSGLTDSNEIKTKIKKTYKNRYFLIISK